MKYVKEKRRKERKRKKAAFSFLFRALFLRGHEGEGGE